MFGSPSLLSFSKDGISGASSVSFSPNTSIYNIYCEGKAIKITVTDKATIVDKWVQDINIKYAPNSSVIVGLGVESNPSRIGYGSPRNKSATLNLCIDDKCLILQLFHIDNLPLSLKNFLMNPNIFFVGYNVVNDITKIKCDYGLDFGGAHADIKKLAKKKWPGRFQRLSLKDLAKDLLGLSLKKPKLVSLSNWESRVLNIEQVEYGCINCYVSYKIGHKLLRDD